MANHSIKTVSSTPVLVSPAPTFSGADVIIQNNSTAANVYLGASDVSLESYGFKLAAGSAISLRLGGKDSVYAVADATATVSVLTVGLA
jgi:hypothetical protein